MSFPSGSADAISNASDILMRQDSGFYGDPIQCACHDDKGTMSAFSGLFTERFIKGEKFFKSTTAADIHDPFIVLRTFRGETIWTVGLKLDRKSVV